MENPNENIEAPAETISVSSQPEEIVTATNTSMPAPAIDKEGLKNRVFAASRLSNEDKNFLIDLINKA